MNDDKLYQKKATGDDIELAYQGKTKGDIKLPSIRPNAVNNGNFNMLENMDENIRLNEKKDASPVR